MIIAKARLSNPDHLSLGQFRRLVRRTIIEACVMIGCIEQAEQGFDLTVVLPDDMPMMRYEEEDGSEGWEWDDVVYEEVEEVIGSIARRLGVSAYPEAFEIADCDEIYE